MNPSPHALSQSNATTEGNPLQPDAPNRSNMRGLIISLLINGFLPWLIYKVLTQHTHFKELYALGATSIPSLIDAVYGIARYRKMDFLAGFTLFTVAVSLGLVALGGSPKLYLVRESLFTGAIGLAMIVSLAFRRPLLWYLMRYVLTKNDPAQAAEFERDWGGTEGIRYTRVISAIFGVIFVVEVALRVYMAYHLPTDRFLAVSPFVFYGGGALMFAAIFGYSRLYRRNHPDSEFMAKLKQQRDARFKQTI